ncbi:hypothetical protein SAMN04488067_103170 [Halorubrum xinjiangense]|uniref:Uncharacterized protein n=1 Tax=Halorubrum xinjiangense TaxID=261291 RepID=A0A1G7K1W5_9EURY|nr:hypothetical protein SAMN04488067_103170 [Halorubrum xinjiangense]
MRTGASDLVLFQGILSEINGAVRGSEPIDDQIEMCLDRLELTVNNLGRGGPRLSNFLSRA